VSKKTRFLKTLIPQFMKKNSPNRKNLSPKHTPIWKEKYKKKKIRKSTKLLLRHEINFLNHSFEL